MGHTFKANIVDLGLHSKIALVCAASRGLGRTCAEVLAEEGALVAICSRNLSALEITAQQICDRTGGEVIPVACDLSVETQVQYLVNQVRNHFGSLDIFVHNAGGSPSKPAESVTGEEWDLAIRLNLQSFVWLTQAAISLLRERGGGRIIAITSISVKNVLDNIVLSNTTSLGIASFAKMLANKLAADRILVNMVCPGPNATQRMKDLIAIQAIQRGVTEEEVTRN